MNESPERQWSSIDFSTMPNSKRDELLQEIVSSEVAKYFAEEPIAATPFEAWLIARFRGLGRHSELTEEEAGILYVMASIKSEAWDLLSALCEAALLETDYRKRRPLPLPLGKFLVLRLRGGIERPKGNAKQGNKRDKNLYRNYFIHHTLRRLYEAGMKKEPARALVAHAFNENGHHMVTIDVVHHVQRDAARYDKEFAAFDAASEEARKNRDTGILAQMLSANPGSD